jgi:uncharacterized protein YgbK (DUF1537 family)
MTPFLAYYGDDFTGSTDALEFLTRAGARTVLFTGVPTPERLARFGDLDAVGVAGCTRALSPVDMVRELGPAFAALRSLGAPHVHYKVCSTFDSSPQVGSIGRAIDVGAEIFGGRFVPLVVGAPPLGRYCVFGNLFARFGIGSAGGIYRLDRHPAMSRHPVTPADESDLRRHLARQTSRRSELIDVLTLAKSEAECRTALDQVVASGAAIVLFDVLEMSHLAKIGALLQPLGRSEQPLFSVGSSAVEMALGAHWQAIGRLQPRTTWEEVFPAKPLLVVSGSCSPVTLGQIRAAVRGGFAEVPFDPDANGNDLAHAIRAAVTHVRAGQHTVVHTNPPDLWETAPARNAQPGSPGSAPTAAGSAELGTAIGRIAREVMAATGVRRLVVAGGDTSSYAARALGIEAVEMIAPLAPGAPLCRAHAPGSPADGIEVNFKGGQVGPEDYFTAIANGKLS